MKKLFINRKAEIKKLLSGLKKGNDYILIAPRRFGKTALAKKVLNELREDKNNIVVNIDLMSYASGSIESVAECILEKLLNALGFTGKLRNLWRNLDFTFNLRMKYQDLEIEPLIHMFKNSNDGWALLEEALQLPEQIAIKQKKRVIVFYDEFGELHNLGERIIKLFRSVLQHHDHVSYLFAGSQETTMNNIFLDKSGAFYRFGEIIYLKELSKEDVYQYVIEHYPKVGVVDNGLRDFRIMNAILEQLDGHPYYTAQVIKYFEDNQNCSYEDFYTYLRNDLFERERAYLEQQLLKINEKKHAIDVLRVIAMGLAPYKEIHGLSDQHVYTVLCYLENGGYIRKESRGVYKIVDPLLSMLLLDI